MSFEEMKEMVEKFGDAYQQIFQNDVAVSSLAVITKMLLENQIPIENINEEGIAVLNNYFANLGKMLVIIFYNKTPIACYNPEDKSMCYFGEIFQIDKYECFNVYAKINSKFNVEKHIMYRDPYQKYEKEEYEKRTQEYFDKINDKEDEE